jgi:signal transduction histidine kinase
MKLGMRITLTTVTLVSLTLGLYGFVSLRARHAELAADSERQMSLLGSSVRIPLEAALKDAAALERLGPTGVDEARRLFEDTAKMVARWQEAEPQIGFIYIDVAHVRNGQAPAFVVGKRAEHPEIASEDDATHVYLPAPPDPTRAQRLQVMTVEKRAVGDHLRRGGRDLYVLMEPVRDDADRVVAAVELTRDESGTERLMAESQRAVVLAVGGLGLLLALMVWLTTRQGITSPLKRLVEAIDDVTHGDIGRVILRERDDEVGDLAERFNEMTGSLREARAQILAGVDAKLALEQRLRHSEKLATIGQLAAGLAHEVGTPLNVIGGRARTLEKKASSEELSAAEVAKNAGIIAVQTQRITKIIQQLLDFARRPAKVRTSVDLHAVAKDTLDFLEHQLQVSRVEVLHRPFVIGDGRTEGSAVALLPPELPLVHGDADQLQQVCLNLCLNAIQAMPQGGALELASRGLVRRRPGLDAADPGRYVVLEVSDTGVGIPEADRERIFEPFYSTKAPPQEGKSDGGTGLGLAVSVGIVKDHDGWIEIDNRAGGGTLFRVFLPAAEPIEVVQPAVAESA